VEPPDLNLRPTDTEADTQITQPPRLPIKPIIVFIMVAKASRNTLAAIQPRSNTLLNC